MKQIKLGKWIINFDKHYRIVKDDNTLIVLDNEREAIVVISINKTGNLQIERTYYAMIYEIVVDDNIVNFITVED